MYRKPGGAKNSAGFSMCVAKGKEMNLVSNGVKYHAKEPQRFFNRFSFICGVLRLLHILCLCLIVAFPPNDSAFPFNLRDILC